MENENKNLDIRAFVPKEIKDLLVIQGKSKMILFGDNFK